MAKKKLIPIKVSEEVHSALKKLADNDRRSLSMFVVLALEKIAESAIEKPRKSIPTTPDGFPTEF